MQLLDRQRLGGLGGLGDQQVVVGHGLAGRVLRGLYLGLPPEEILERARLVLRVTDAAIGPAPVAFQWVLHAAICFELFLHGAPEDELAEHTARWEQFALPHAFATRESFAASVEAYLRQSPVPSDAVGAFFERILDR